LGCVRLEFVSKPNTNRVVIGKVWGGEVHNPVWTHSPEAFQVEGDKKDGLPSKAE